MKYILAAALPAALVLSACGEGQAPKAPAEQAVTATPAPAASTTAAKTVTGSGAVSAVDAAEGTITIDHDPIPEAGWPAMNMAFKANPPSLANQVKAGDKVSFEAVISDGAAPEVVAVRPQ